MASEWRWLDQRIARDRIVFFSDAVFAIAITLLVLRIPVPERQSGAELEQRLLSLWPKYLSYVVSFLVVAGFWLRHLQLATHLERFDGRLAAINLVALLLVAFLPFPTAVYANHALDDVATVIYAASLAAAGAAFSAMAWYTVGHPALLTAGSDRAALRLTARLSLLQPVGFALSVPIGWVAPALAATLWTLLLVAMIALRLLTRRRRA